MDKRAIVSEIFIYLSLAKILITDSEMTNANPDQNISKYENRSRTDIYIF